MKKKLIKKMVKMIKMLTRILRIGYLVPNLIMSRRPHVRRILRPREIQGKSIFLVISYDLCFYAIELQCMNIIQYHAS